jgi:PAS domain S-box-containing protein
MSKELLSQERWQALDISPDAIILVNQDGVITYFNAQAERLFGYSRAEISGLKIEELIPAECRELHVNYRIAFMSDPHTYCGDTTREVMALRKDGSELPVDIRLRYVEEDDGELICASIRDASLRLQRDEAIRSIDARYRDLLETMNEGFGEVDHDFIFTYVNTSFCKMLGYSREEMVGELLLDFIHDDDRELMKHQMDLRRRGIAKRFALTFARKDGERVYTLAAPKAVFDEQQNFLGSFGVITDITRLKLDELVLKASERRYRSLVETIPHGIQESDLDGKIIFSNKAHSAIHGCEEGELLGKAVWELTRNGADRERLRNYYKYLVESRPSPSPFFTQDLTKDGNIIDVQVDWDYQYDEFGNLTGIVSVITDITKRKQAEQELEQHRQHLETMVAERTSALEDAIKDLESFSYSVSHDLRAPLRSIDGFSQMLLEDCTERLDAVGVDYLQRIRSSAQHMGRLIDDMLSLSSVTRCELNRENVDLSAIAHAVISKLQGYDPQREVEVVIDPGIYGRGDARLINILLDNLLGNAWKYTGKTEKARIVFDKTVKDGKTTYRVRDNGAGFSMEYRDKIFGDFQRLHKADEFEGTGIGLATVERIIRRHGGQVWVKAEVGQGAAFYFTLGEEETSSGNKRHYTD